MTLYNNATKHYAAYTAAHHTTTNKTRQVVMLYDGAIRSVRQAQDAMSRGDIETRYNALTNASAIINGLQAALDFAEGGDVARLLDDYYFSIDMRLLSLHHAQNTEMCESILGELKMMRDAWHDVDTRTAEPHNAEEGLSPALIGAGTAHQESSRSIDV